MRSDGKKIIASGQEGRLLKSVFEDVNVSSIVQDTFVGNFNIEVIKSKATMQRGYRSMYDGDLPNMIIQIAKDAYPHFNTNSENDSYYKELDLKRIEKRWKLHSNGGNLKQFFFRCQNNLSHVLPTRPKRNLKIEVLQKEGQLWVRSERGEEENEDNQ